MNNYKFYAEGIDEYFLVNGENEKEARQSVWNGLDSDDKDRVVLLDMVDVVAI